MFLNLLQLSRFAHHIGKDQLTILKGQIFIRATDIKSLEWYFEGKLEIVLKFKMPHDCMQIL